MEGVVTVGTFDLLVGAPYTLIAFVSGIHMLGQELVSSKSAAGRKVAAFASRVTQLIAMIAEY